MKERIWYSALLEMLVAFACLLLGFGEQGLVVLIVCLLASACLLAGKLLVELLEGPLWATVALAFTCVMVMFWYRSDLILPLLIALLTDLVAPRIRRESVGVILLVLVVAALVALILPQSTASLFGAVVAFALMLAGHALAQRSGHLAAELAVKDERLVELQTRLEHQRTTITTIEQQTRLAERNRLAARIHDKVGHGITGSVLMLEAAQLQMPNDPQAAQVSIARATDNLRESVDDIRRELREERPATQQASRASIAATLAEFSSSHPSIATELETEGTLETIPQGIWVCIHESLLETLTNVLKHTNASHFRVFISHINRLVYVEFADTGSINMGGVGAVQRDGGSARSTTTDAVGVDGEGARLGAPQASGASHEPHTLRTINNTWGGLGLIGIEERVALSGGKVFFSQTSRGFKTKMTFTLKGSTVQCTVEG